MADCSSAGTALDRVARTLLNNNVNSNAASAAAVAHGGSSGSQLLANFLGHATVSMWSVPPAPPPQSLVRPTDHVAASLSTVTIGPTNEMVPRVSSAPVGTLTPSVAHPYAPQRVVAPGWHHPSHHVPLHHSLPHHPQHHGVTQDPYQHHPTLHARHAPHVMMQQQQQQQHFAMQQHMLSQQQQRIWMQHQQLLQHHQQQQHLQLQRQQNQQTAAAAAATTDTQEPAVVGHEGIVHPVSMEHLSNAWAEALQDDQVTVVEGHEGVVGSATMEQLAAAWRDAQTEAEALWDGDDEYFNNLWTGDPTMESLYPDGATEYHAPMGTYEFTHSKDTWSPDDLTTNWMEVGHAEFDAGNIQSAIQAFEYELLRDGESGQAAAAWRMLGRCHAEHDMDARAIPCLEQAVEHDPYSAPARLALGVSHVNELNHVQALHHLKAWITHNPKFAGLDVPDVYGSSHTSDTEGAFDEVQRLLLSALQFQSATDNGTNETADILEALGVVYNVSRDYDAAVDVFQKACDIRPDDYQLWNKLGATLANSNRSKEALPAYHRALQLKPKYARAWLNMAISHSNLQQYDEAARCYLQTLSLNPAAQHCWSYLRIALSCAEKWDLIPATATRDLAAFRPHYDFIPYDL